MQVYYASFGQQHRHSIGGKFFDKDSLAQISGQTYLEIREKAIRLFGEKFAVLYSREKVQLSYFPRGIITTDDLI